MKKIYFVRHAESIANATRFHHGNDIELSEKGEKQAAILGERFKTIPIDAVISSDYRRAVQTAEKIASTTRAPHIVEAFLGERGEPSIAHGKSFDDPEVVAAFTAMHDNMHDSAWRHSDEETAEMIKHRAFQCLEYLAKREEENIAVVSHGIFLRAVFGAVVFGERMNGQVLSDLMHHLGTQNTGITLCHYYENGEKPHSESGRDIRWIVTVWNDSAHLGN